MSGRQQSQPVSARPQDLPVKADLARLRVRYHKDSRLAFLGHLDLISTVERCVRRSGLPFSIGNGFARRMRVQFSSALPTGTSPACEYFDVRLLEAVVALLRRKGWRVANADLTILAEAPKIAPRVQEMRERLAAPLGVPVDAVSVKATTMEKLGPIGAREGIAAQAVALLESVS